MSLYSVSANLGKLVMAVVMICLINVGSALAEDTPETANELPTDYNSYIFDSVAQSLSPRAAGDVYTITGDANRTVPPGTYSSIIVQAPASSTTSPDIIIGAGAVTLTGENGSMFHATATGTSNKVQLQTTGDAAVLRLNQGEATGIIGVGLLRSRASNRDNMLYIGSGENGVQLETVTLNGSINGIGRSAIERYTAESLVETQGANLVVKGNISNNQLTSMLRTLNAYNGNIETDSGGVEESSPGKFDIYAYNVNLKSGYHVSAAVDFFASSVNIPENSYIYGANRVDVVETIGEKGGIMNAGSRLESNKMVVLRGGVSAGAGLIKSGTRSILSHDTYGNYTVETALFPIRQGGNDSLVLEAGQDILPGDADVDTMRAGRDIVAGTLTSRVGTDADLTNALPGRYLLNAGGEGLTYPRFKISANTIEAQGRLLAGELNMPRGDGKEANLTAGNMWITNSAPAENGFAQASGNFTLDNGSFTLTNQANMEISRGLEDTRVESVTLDYASIIDGDMNVTRNKSSSFTSLHVNKNAGVSEGALKGTLFDVAGNLTIKDEVAVQIAHTIVGQTAKITGGSYAGTDFSANSANFTNTAALTFTGALPPDSKANLHITENLTIAGNQTVNIDKSLIGGNADISGGSYTGTDFEATNGDASFTNVNSLAMSGATKTGGNLTIQNGTAALGTMEIGKQFSLDSGYLTAKNATALSASFTNQSSAEFDDLTLASDDLSLTIDSGSTVFINHSLTDPKGIVAVDGGGELIIHGENDTPTTTIDIYIARDTTIAQERGIYNLTKGLYGGDPDGPPSNAAFTQLMAGEVKITNTNLTLAGIGNYANKVDKDLIIYQNGASRLGDIQVGGNVEIDKGSLVAASMKVAGNASFDDVNLTLAGTEANPGSIGGDLSLTHNTNSDLGNITVAGRTKIDGGITYANNLTSASADLYGAIMANIRSLVITDKSGELNIGASGEAASVVTANHVEMNGAALNIYGDSALQIYGGDASEEKPLELGLINIPQDGTLSAFGDIKASAVSLGSDGSQLAGANVTVEGIVKDMKGGAITATEGNITLQAGAEDAQGQIAANHDIIARGADGHKAIAGQLDLEAGGNVEAEAIDVNSISAGANVAATDIKTGVITTGEDVSVSDGSLNISGEGSKVGGNLSVPLNVNSSFTTLEVAGRASFKNGELKAASLISGSAKFENIRAAFEELVLKEPATDHDLTIKGSADAGSEVTAAKLDLNGGKLSVESEGVAPARMYAREFGQASSLINGHIAINANGLLVLGAQNGTLLEMPNALQTESLATFALAQPMRLDNRYGIYITGAGVPQPAANQITFDAASLYVIDSKMNNAVYSYLGTVASIVPSLNLNESNGAIGALSADNASADANIKNGAQIFIRNPEANTVIVALGQNINTLYEDKESSLKTRANNSAPWTGSNLDYDNKSNVKILRLEGQYAGQFLVLPVDAPDPFPPDTPDNPPVTPENPDIPPVTPDNPDTPPVTPENPDTPVVPDNPDNPPATPDNPDTPVTPENPDTPPITPENPPVAPENPDEQPSRPAISKPPSQTLPNAHPGIHEVIENGSNNGTIGTEPHHLAQNNGRGFISQTLAHDSPHEATRLLEGSSRMIILGGVPQMLRAANEAGQNAMEQRLGIVGLPWARDEIHTRSFALWAVPLYRTSAGWNLQADAFDYAWHGGLGGVAIGGDITWQDMARAGISFNIGGGYSKSGGDLSETANNMNFWGIGAYSGLVYGNFAVSADVNFTSSYNKLKQDVSVLDNWQELKADARAYMLSAALDLEYGFDMGIVNIIPHAGFKYDYIYVDDYNIYHRGDKIIHGKAFSQNIWTFPMGARFARNFKLANGWEIRPEIDLRVTPASGEIYARTSTRYTGTDLDIDLNTQTMDYITWGGKAGLEAKTGNFTVGINYDARFGSHTAAQGIFGLLRYEF